MSTTEDIRIKISADETGATASLRKLRTEVVSNEQGLKKLGAEGRTSGKALKDMASFLGPEFQILGDRIDHISGSLEGVNNVGLLAKASLVGLVAVGGFQVGQMLSNLIFQTEAWQKAHSEAAESISRQQSFLAADAERRFDNEIKIANLAASAEQKKSELIVLASQKRSELTEAENELIERQKELNVALGNDFLGYGKEDNAIAEEGVRIARERVSLIKQQLNAVVTARQGGGPSGRAAELAKREEEAARRTKEATAAIAEKAKQEQLAAAQSEKLQATQEGYLGNLELELVRLKEGEEAYTRATLAKQGFTEATIENALAMKQEIAELNDLRKSQEDSSRQRESTAANGGRATMPGAVQATETRGLTRGVGMRDQDKILAATNKQVEKMQLLVVEQKRQTDLLNARLPRGVL